MQKNVVRVSKVNGVLVVSNKESTSSTLEQIVRGNINHIFPTDYVLELSEARLSICRACVLYINTTNGKCDKENYVAHEQTGEPVKGCGCSLNQKTKNYDSHCPAMKWGAFKDEADYLSERSKNLI